MVTAFNYDDGEAGSFVTPGCRKSLNPQPPNHRLFRKTFDAFRMDN